MSAVESVIRPVAWDGVTLSTITVIATPGYKSVHRSNKEKKLQRYKGK